MPGIMLNSFSSLIRRTIQYRATAPSAPPEYCSHRVSITKSGDEDLENTFFPIIKNSFATALSANTKRASKSLNIDMNYKPKPRIVDEWGQFIDITDEL
mmetsp:Transcript_98479/g.199910  ORF Transcript_98479/g.199910 Transcript_98479/m.199910 type:complete len:99 (+) Transcript_98479:222-518(+)